MGTTCKGRGTYRLVTTKSKFQRKLQSQDMKLNRAQRRSK